MFASEPFELFKYNKTLEGFLQVASANRAEVVETKVTALYWHFILHTKLTKLTCIDEKAVSRLIAMLMPANVDSKTMLAKHIAMPLPFILAHATSLPVWPCSFLTVGGRPFKLKQHRRKILLTTNFL